MIQEAEGGHKLHNLNMSPHAALLLIALVGTTLKSACSVDLRHDNMTTSGVSGEACTDQGVKCLTSATCEDEQCICPDDERGPAEIECVKKDDTLCFVVGNLEIKSFSQARAPMVLPCRYPLTRFVTDKDDSVDKYDSCSFEVFATNGFDDGRYFLGSVHVIITIYDPLHSLYSHADIYITASNDASNSGVYNYHTRTESFSIPDVPGVGIPIRPSFDEENNFVVISLPECEGTLIKFRAYDHALGGQQTQVPGVTIKTAKHSEFVEDVSNYPNTMCGNSRESSSLYEDRADQLSLTDGTTAVLYDMLSLRPHQLDNDMGKSCEEAFHAFNSSTSRADDVNKCAYIVTSEDVTKCIRHHHLQPIDIFTSCLTYWQSSKLFCQRFLEAAKECDVLGGWAGPSHDDIHCSAATSSTP